jgi:hypothetical protein
MQLNALLHMQRQERILFPVYVFCGTGDGKYAYEFNISAILTVQTKEYQKIN